MKSKGIALIILVLICAGIVVSGGYLDLNDNNSGSNDITIIENPISTQGPDTDDLRRNISVDSLINGTATVYANPDDEEGGVGSAFMYTDEHLVTNQHVVEDADTVKIRYDKDTWSEGEVIGSDKFTDVAVIRVDSKPPNAKPIPVQQSLPNPGEGVLAVGSPLGLEGSVSNGIVSGTDRSITVETSFSVPDMIQSDAALNSGNSGGPLVSTSTGAVVGMNTATEGENIGYAVSARIFDRIAKSLIETGDHRHAYIGIRTLEYNPINQISVEDIDSGLVVRGVQEGSPADGKIQDGSSSGDADIIKSVDGQEIVTNEDLASYLIRNEVAGNTLNLGVYRDGSMKNVTVETVSRQSIGS